VRVVDMDGEPVTGAALRLASGDDGSRAGRGGVTDDQGSYCFRSLPPQTYILTAGHPTLGVRPALEVSIALDRAQECVVRLSAEAILDLLVVDGDEPLAGIACRLTDALGTALASPVLTSDAGIARLPRLTPGSYKVEVRADSIWPASVSLEAVPGKTLETVEVRRRGDLLIRVLAPDGLPVSGAEIGLIDVLTGESVALWIEAGKVGGADSLKSDKHGELHLAGLPRGEYTWTLGSAQGLAIVKAGDETLALLSAQ
jgi:hypothetical protein